MTISKVETVGIPSTHTGCSRAFESKGVAFDGETFDTGGCHMATFADPDGNVLVLHNRYAPYS